VVAEARVTSALLFAATLLVFLVGARNGGTDDTKPAQLLPISILTEGNLDFNEFVCPTDPATGAPSRYDPATCTAPLPYYLDVVDGRVVSHYPIIAGLLNLPAHLVAYLFQANLAAHYGLLSVITSALISAASVTLMFLVLIEICRSPATALGGALVYAFGTLVWSVTSRGLWQHGPSLLLINGALLLLVRRNGAQLPWAGLLLGLAVFNRPTNVLLAIPLGLYVLVHHRARFLRFTAAAALPMAVMVLYSALVLGSATALGQGQGMRFGADPLGGLLGILFSPARGLFVFTPVFLLSLLMLPRVLNGAAGHPIVRYLVAGTLALVGLYAFWPIWWGGHSFGYRLLIEVIPGFIVLLALGWEEVIRGSRPLQGVAGVLLAASVYVNYLGARVGPCGFDMSPNSIDAHPERLWQVRDTELIRCSRELGTRVGTRIGLLGGVQPR